MFFFILKNMHLETYVVNMDTRSLIVCIIATVPGIVVDRTDTSTVVTTQDHCKYHMIVRKPVSHK